MTATGHTFDVVVAGLGIAGASLTHALAGKGVRVLGLDVHDSPHTVGSSHGRSRVIRAAYFENPLYVPLADRAFTLWRELERETGSELLRETGALMIGPQSSEVVQGTLASVRAHSLPHEVLDAAAMRRRFPALTPRPSDVGVLERRAGMLAAESCVQTLLRQAVSRGAELRMREPLLAWDAGGSGVRVRTSRGTLSAGALVLAVGPWLPALTEGDWPGRALEVERQYVLFLEPRETSRIGPDLCPITIWEHENSRVFYTLPDIGDGFKAAVHHEGERFTGPDDVTRTVSDAEVATIRALLDQLVPAANGPLRERLVCIYTNTRDHHFLIDAHPAVPDLFVLSACSGHGFKFGPAIGEAVADWVLTRERPAALTPFFARPFS
jgi:sarcosine oxidase